MKNIKSFQIFNENIFAKPKENDEFAKELINIINTENIKIELISYNHFNNKRDTYLVEIDNIKYKFIHSNNTPFDNQPAKLLIYQNSFNAGYMHIDKNDEPNILNISSKYINQLDKIFVKQQKLNNIEKSKQKLNNLPDISEIGRDTKKFNL